MAALLSFTSSSVSSAEPPAIPDSGALTVTLPEALELALVRSFALRGARLDERDAEAQGRVAGSAIWPRVDGSIRYTRTIFAVDPFAGTAAGQTFDGFEAVGWLQFNERARLEGRNPISFEEYQRRTTAALAAAGVDTDPDRDPFLVENQVQLGVGVTQILFDEAAFASIAAADVAKAVAEVGIDVEAQEVARAVSTTYYGALLADRQTEILKQSVDRARANVEDTARRVEQGLLPPFQKVTAEVELANLETSLVRAETDAKNAVDEVRLAIGLPPTVALVLRDELDLRGLPLEVPPLETSVATAFEKRPDLVQARLLIEAAQAEERLAFAGFLPRISAFGNLALNGAIPDDRRFAVPVGEDPFALRAEENGLFADPFWFPTFSLGLQLDWNLFEGFGTVARVERGKIAVERRELAVEEARLRVRLEVEASVRELAAAKTQIDAQSRTLEQAELNYEQVEIRVREGISTQFDLRQASQQLDESRFNRLRAVHDFLVARVAYLVAIGTPPVP